MSLLSVEAVARRLPAVPAVKGLVPMLAAGIGVLGLLAALVHRASTPYMAMATVNYGLLVLGLLWRHHRRLHAGIMSLGIAGDILLVLTLEFQRDAINTAMSFSLSPLQQAHIGVSTLATVLYIPTLYYGIQRMRGGLDRSGRARHLALGLLAFVFRTMGFVFMFSLLGRHVSH